MYKTEKIQQENIELKQENIKLENEVETLKEFIDKTFECVSLLFDFPINRLKSIVKNFWNKIKE